MLYSTISRSKFGDCSQCPTTNTDVVKRGKLLFCLSCARNNKAKEQVSKANQRSAVRKLSNRYIPKSDAAILNDKVEKEKWFRLIRTKLAGTCQCGCGNPSSKGDYKDLNGKIVSQFRSSICHIFPKRDFYSIKYHPLNYVERAFWGGCHTNMDNQSMDKWVNMADWEDIKAKFFVLAPLLTDEERKFKFYTHLEYLVYNN